MPAGETLAPRAGPENLAILRHAPTEWNALGRLQGLTDTCLSPEGEAAARSWRLPAPADGWQRIASPLRRARRTAELVQPSAAVTVESALREMSFGVWEGRTLVEYCAGELEAVSQGLDEIKLDELIARLEAQSPEVE